MLNKNSIIINEHIIIYNKNINVTLLLVLLSNLVFFNLNTKFQHIFLVLSSLQFNSYFLSSQNYFNVYKKYIYYVYVYHTLKLTFRGKGYRVRKFKKTFKYTFHFGRSHWTKLLLHTNNVLSKRFTKQKFFFLAKFVNSFTTLSFCLQNIKKINHYTKRGLRLRSQVIKKRFGKVSQVTSSLF